MPVSSFARDRPSDTRRPRKTTIRYVISSIEAKFFWLAPIPEGHGSAERMLPFESRVYVQICPESVLGRDLRGRARKSQRTFKRTTFPAGQTGRCFVCALKKGEKGRVRIE